MRPLRLMVYDRTCTGAPVGLTDTWAWGGRLYGALRRIDRWQGVASWDEALRWLVSHDAPIAEVQYWGHGRWGQPRVADDVLDRAALTGRLSAPLDAVRERLTPDALWWFRTCEAFGARPGHDFAQAFTDRMGCDAAGHTFIIGPWQSGLHRLSPGEAPRWSAWEGLARGTPDAPRTALWSWPHCPNTVSCLAGRVPDGW